jgi:hypothetical protein
MTVAQISRRHDRLASVMSRFTLPVGSVVITRRSSTTYHLSWLVAPGQYVQLDMTQISALPGGNLVFQMNFMRGGVPMLSIDDTDASVVRSGTWNRPFNNTAAYGGSYGMSTSTGAHVTFTSPANSTSLGLRTVQAVNGGLAKVEINGDATLANLCKTAQQVVDDGTFANTILVANGGSLNPTDRVFDFYSPTSLFDSPVAVASGLAAGTHTLRLTVTGYKRSAATDVRVYDSGYSYATASTAITDSGALIFGTEQIQKTNSAFEFAWNVLPSGATTRTFIGRVHGYEIQDSFAVTVDGASQTMTDGQTILGSTIVLAQTTRLRHPDTGTTDIANISITYTMTRGGLRVETTTDWLVTASVGAGYPGMIPMDASFDRGNSTGRQTPVTLTAGDGSFKGAAKAHAGWLWQSAGKYAALLYSPKNPAPVVNWQYAPLRFLGFEDRAPVQGLRINKLYYTRQTGTGTSDREDVVNGTRWTSDIIYRFAYFPGGANAALAAA